MKKFIKSFFSCRDSSINLLYLLLLLPAFTESESLFSAVVIALTSVFLTFINFFVIQTLNCLKIKIYSLPLIMLISGAVSILLCAFFQKNDIITYSIFSSGAILSLFVFCRTERNCSDVLKENLAYTLRTLAIVIAPLILMSTMREFLSSGKIFSGFTNDGIVLFTHKFGPYINSISFILLFLAIVSLIFAIFFKSKLDTLCSKYTFNGVAKMIIFALAISVITGFITVPLNQLFINSSLFAKTYLLIPYIFAAIVSLVIKLLSDNREVANSLALLIVVFSICFCSSNAIGELISAIITFAVPSIIIALFCDLWIGKFCSNNRTSITIALAYSSIVTLIF